MSKEYIDREEVILAVRHAWAKGLEPTQYIEQIPAADVAPVVHGKWVKDENSCHYDYYLTYFDFNCSICGEIENDQHGLPNYCPNCGAKMEGQ